VSYVAQIAGLESAWDNFSGEQGSSRPVASSDKDREELEADFGAVVGGMQVMRAIRDGLGELFPEHGIVMSEDYEEAPNGLL